MNYEFKILEKNEVRQYASEFNELEKQIEYPLEDGSSTFIIDHGKAYHTFFSQQGHKSRFLAIKYNKQIIGTLAAVWKEIEIKDKKYNGIYFADLKLHNNYRKKGIINTLFWYLLLRWPFNKKFQQWDFAYYCAMLRSGKGVEKSFNFFNPAKLAKPSAMLNIYMIDPNKIASINSKSDYYKNNGNGINLSPIRDEMVFWNDGIKDIISKKDNTIIPLGHLHPQFFNNVYSVKHKNAIDEICNKKGALACFGIDSRQKQIIQWLDSYNISTQTKCKIFSFSPFAPSLRNINSLYISTGEI